ncbi:MAG TPA: hypothetical protein VFS24_15855 [Steroidobacteraceae bacterium]|nr:hypothetical protein [Steroidobacteraceae bacterium]
MQSLLARLYDAPVEHEVSDFVLHNANRVRALIGIDAQTDEQVFVVEDRDSVRVGVYISSEVLERLSKHDPMHLLDDDNLADFCTALEGVSHFHYLMWNVGRGRKVSLLELELQAEVDKYAAALALMTRQRDGRFPHALHPRLFHHVAFAPSLDPQSRHRYEEANRHAARYCRALEERFLRTRHSRPERWLGELRKFFRAGQQEKLRASG